MKGPSLDSQPAAGPGTPNHPALRGVSAEGKIAVLQEVGGIGFWTYDVVGERVHLDARLQEIYGYQHPTGPVVMDLESWRGHILPEDRPWVFQRFWQAFRNDEPWQLRFRLVRPDAEIRHLRCEGRLTAHSGGKPRYAVGFEEDITDRVLLERELERQAQHDPLTGTSNRRRMDHVLHDERERALRYQDPLSLLIIDGDGFKQINDTYGHEAGDLLLHELVQSCFRPQLRTADHLGRWGGDEFLVVLPQTDESGAIDVAERIRERVATLQPGPGHVTVSIGIATYRPPEATGAWLRRADLALYEAKRTGRNRVVRYREGFL
ncbi:MULTISPECIES: sensor domain-containing diguanylate cyclase [Halorhodospira]|uniref:sensor domain-containing diguanylate cyclase n=1 Tax=Halorhodospira TaxID=85108 RepID=UPI001EE7AE9F|nr:MULTISPECIES: sensor domain-containing diguanylate cyclase [Halorhodospira]MCG5527993.1 sensor domain-containing diguanylate cyclase [Halorhodospira halophila]MCG5542137.1 sensor domain-containing diguanylate cyclase [Halorhodospira sp. 9628]